MVSGSNRQRGTLKKWILALSMIMLVFVLLNPAEGRYYGWLEREYGITLEEYDYLDGKTFVKDGERMYEAGHTRNALFFTIKDMKYYDMDHNELVYEISTVGILGTFFERK
ncbi:hypothetical protein QPK24_06555 [Paenibacillus polygoni]|uniref:Uncharacterized protein n=1 Tax=Paenibacillus polygoni TaxID=3050112 RepID=A0ABY8XAY1_9BACL|nr:hypothetical protein [Paenibacillus polygoni]WIV20350.1 hypothetical protein QPK24_06555 [Paenibacillus polygoni]